MVSFILNGLKLLKKWCSSPFLKCSYRKRLLISACFFSCVYFALMCSKKKVKITQPQFEAVRGAHLLFYSHEPAYKMTYDCWLDIR